MTYRELTTRLRRLGIEFRRQAGGSHEIWRNPQKNLYTVIPRHGRRDIKRGTLAKILKDLELTQSDLNDG
jgi:predicted RNA binding protein YcfA (HicA-like mRNA interferase family)